MAILALIVFFLAGAYYTGETARAALFIYPFIFISLGIYLPKLKPTLNQQKLLLTLVFVQTILMQLLGSFGW